MSPKLSHKYLAFNPVSTSSKIVISLEERDILLS